MRGVRREVIGLNVALLVAALYASELAPTRVMQIVRLRLQDVITMARYRTQPLPPELKNLVLVSIGDDSYQAMGIRWPWDRTVMAKAVDRLHDLGPRLICLDLIFGGETTPESDRALADALGRAGNVVIGAYFGRQEEYVEPQVDISSGAQAIGTLNRLRGADFRMRIARIVHLKPTLEIEAYAMEVLALAAILDAQPEYRENVLRFVTPQGIEKHRVPVRMDGGMPIRPYVRAQDMVTIPIHKLLQDPVDPSLAEMIRGKVIMVGLTGYVFHDYHPTPLGPEPGVMLLVNALLTMQRGEVPTEVPWAVQLVLLTTCALVAVGLAYFTGPWLALAVVSAMLGAFGAASVVLERHCYTWDYLGVPLVVLVVFGAAMFHRYVSQAVELARLRLQATTDGLTGVANFRYFQVRLEHELARVRRGDSKLAVLMLDLDNFKSINDRYGHRVGNDVLKGVVNIMKRRLHQTDLIARFGGDEFCVLIFDGDLHAAERVGGDLVRMLGQCQFATGQGPFQAAMSVGATAIEPGSQATAEQVLEQADLALYQSKRDGKGRVTLFRSEFLADPDMHAQLNELRRRLA